MHLLQIHFKYDYYSFLQNVSKIIFSRIFNLSLDSVSITIIFKAVYFATHRLVQTNFSTIVKGRRAGNLKKSLCHIQKDTKELQAFTKHVLKAKMNFSFTWFTFVLMVDFVTWWPWLWNYDDFSRKVSYTIFFTFFTPTRYILWMFYPNSLHAIHYLPQYKNTSRIYSPYGRTHGHDIFPTKRLPQRIHFQKV